MTDLIHVNEMYRCGFMIFSFVAMIVLLYEVNKNKKKRGFAYFALIYFACVFVFYLGRCLGIPSDPYLANLLSNIIRTLGSIFIFFVAYLLVKNK